MTARRVAYFFAAALALVAALSLALRLVLPHAGDYTDEVVAALSEAVGAEVRVGSMQVMLRGFEPVVELSEVEVKSYGESDEALHARRLRVEFDLAASLFSGAVKVSDLRVLDTDFLVVTDAEGRSRVSGFLPLDGLSAGVSGGEGADFGFHLENANVRWRNERAGTDYEFKNVNAVLESRDGRFRFGLKTFLPEALGRFLHLVADLDDGLLSGAGQAENGGGRVYLRADGADLARWAQQAGRSGSVAGLLDVELWSGWQDGALRRLDGEVACEACRVADGEAGSPASLQTRLSWEAHEQGWRLGLLDFGWKSPGLTPGLTVHNADAALDYHEDGADLVVRTPALDAATFDAVARLVAPGGAAEAVEVSAGSGSAPMSASLSASLSHERFTPPDFTPPDFTPGESAAAGGRDRLRAVEDGFRFVGEYALGYADRLLSDSTLEAARGELVLKKLSVRFPGWSERVFDLDEASASLGYERDGATRAFRADDLSLRWDDARLGGRFAWLDEGTLSPESSPGPSLDLALTVENLPLASVGGLLPRERLNPKLEAWLGRAFSAGVVESARVELAGAPAAFPFGDGGGRFRAEGKVAGATLNYQTGRRPLTALDARFVFDKRSLVVEAGNLEHYGLRSQSARVSIDDLARPFVTVAASGSGPLAGVFDYLKDARLVNADGVVIRSLEPGGGSRLELSVGAPLSKKVDKPVSVTGALSFADASLRVVPLDLEFNNLAGVLDFDRNGGSSRSLAAVLNGVPVSAAAEPATRVGAGATALRIQGDLDAAQLVDLSQTPLHGAVRGVAPWQAELLIPGLRVGGEYELRMNLSSSLEGAEVALPSPFGKPAAGTREFSAGVELGATSKYELSYGGDIRAALVRGARAPHGYLHFGPGAAPPIEVGRFQISGLIEQPVDIDDWFGAGGGDGLGSYLNDVELSFAELRKGGETLGEAFIELEAGDGGRELRIDAPWAQGWVAIPDAGDRPVFADMRKLFLPKSTPTGASKLNPADLPPLEIEVDEFGLGAARVSALHLVTEPSDRGMRIGRLAFDAGETATVMSGEWSLGEQGHRSRMSFDVNGRDYGKMLRLLGVSSSLKGGDGSLNGRVVWAGPPAGFALEKIEGRVEVNLKDGVIEKADPGIGRLLGLFSIGHIVRRLSLDFRDVIEKGLAFDVLEGKVGFRDSVMRAEDFVIAGPALAMSISGDTDIARKQYDQEITVVPNLSSSLPVAGALLGGPVGAAAVLLVEKLTNLGSKVDKIVTLRYHLHGGWDDPQVDFKGAPEVEKGPGKLKKLFDKVLP